MLDGMKGFLKEFHFTVEHTVDGGGREVVMYGSGRGIGRHSGNELKDDRVILVRTTEDESSVTTEEAQGGNKEEGLGGLPRIVYVKEFVDSAYLRGFLAEEQQAAAAAAAAAGAKGEASTT